MQGILEILKQVPNIINNAFGGLGGIIVTIFAIEGAVVSVKFVINKIRKNLGEKEEKEGDFDLGDDDEIVEIGNVEDLEGFVGIDDTFDLWEYYKEREEVDW
jgi:hypothetical protein